MKKNETKVVKPQVVKRELSDLELEAVVGGQRGTSVTRGGGSKQGGFSNVTRRR